MVDDDMFDKLSKYNWCVSSGYAVRGISRDGGRQWKMHRVIMKAKKNQWVDHIDGNKLNNQRSNLRFATRLQNSRNRKLNKNSKSGFKGVTWCKKHEKWLSSIKLEAQNKHLGYFGTAVEAAVAYDKAAIKHFGKFCRLNNVKL